MPSGSLPALTATTVFKKSTGQTLRSPFLVRTTAITHSGSTVERFLASGAPGKQDSGPGSESNCGTTWSQCFLYSLGLSFLGDGGAPPASDGRSRHLSCLLLHPLKLSQAAPLQRLGKGSPVGFTSLLRSWVQEEPLIPCGHLRRPGTRPEHDASLCPRTGFPGRPQGARVRYSY